MYQAVSQTITEDYKASEAPFLEWKFQIDNGNIGQLNISDQLLDTEALATERAKSEFLKNSYKRNEVTFSTYRTDMNKNDTINIYGIPYLVKSITTQIDGVTMKTKIKAVRYE